MRTHVVLDDALIEAIDAVAGERGRSGFLEEAAREKLARLDLQSALESSFGVVKAEDYPEWADSERVAAWVRATRRTEAQ